MAWCRYRQDMWANPFEQCLHVCGLIFRWLWFTWPSSRCQSLKLRPQKWQLNFECICLWHLPTSPWYPTVAITAIRRGIWWYSHTCCAPISHALSQHTPNNGTSLSSHTTQISIGTSNSMSLQRLAIWKWGRAELALEWLQVQMDAIYMSFTIGFVPEVLATECALGIFLQVSPTLRVSKLTIKFLRNMSRGVSQHPHTEYCKAGKK